MPLDKVSLVLGLVDLFTAQYQGTLSSEQEAEIQTLSDGLADLIDTYTKTATVTVSAGIPVATTGSAVAQTGATTAPGTGTLS